MWFFKIIKGVCVSTSVFVSGIRVRIHVSYSELDKIPDKFVNRWQTNAYAQLWDEWMKWVWFK